jgi:hypothetical protein
LVLESEALRDYDEMRDTSDGIRKEGLRTPMHPQVQEILDHDRKEPPNILQALFTSPSRPEPIAVVECRREFKASGL